MTDKLKKLVKKVLTEPDKVNQILNDPQYGRKSVKEDFGVTNYYAQEIISAINSDPSVDIENMEIVGENDEEGGVDIGQAEERAKDPIDAKDFKVPDKWIYDRNYVFNKDDGKYIFMTREFGNLVRPKSWVKSLVKAYSDWDGDPDTITEVCRRFGITRGVFNEIKRILGLTHDHEPFTPDEVAAKSAGEMAMEAHQQKRFQTKVEFDKLDWKETQKEAKKWRQLKQSLLDEVNADAPSIIVDPIIPEGKDVDVEDIVIHTGDWHMGALAKDLPNIPDYNPGVLRGFVEQMVKLTRTDFPDSRIHVHFNGDSIETVTGMNHADSWKSIADGYYGAKAILETEKILLNFITGLQASSFKAVTGNHGRITSNRKKDHSGEAELLIYEHIKQRLDGVDCDYSDTEITHVVNGIGYIMTHGHLKLTKKSEQKIVQALMSKFDVPVDYIYYEQGHLHNRQTVDDSTYFRHQVMPSLFTGSKYSERAGYGAQPGFFISYKHPTTGKIKVEDYSL